MVNSSPPPQHSTFDGTGEPAGENPTFTPRMQRRMERAGPEIERLLGEMTLEEKVSLCHASGKFQNHGVPRLGIPALVMSDGPHGVRQELAMHGWDPQTCDSDTTTYLPVGSVLAATWNQERAREFGGVLGSESRARGKDVILGPGINIIRDPLCGRNFEYFSEDPFLITQLAPPLIQGVQSRDTAACVKHFALNNQELNRHSVSAEPGEHALRDIYLPGFQASVQEGGALTLMGAYNKFHGQWCCHNRRLLRDILKDEWGFQGAVISDWDGCHVSSEAAENGLDIEMGTTAPTYDDYHLARPFREGLENGSYPISTVDDKVRRILRVVFALGLMGDTDRLPGRQHPPEHLASARRIAEEGVILLKNDGILPLRPRSLRRIAVIGDNADRAHAQGGGSSAVKAFYEVTPLAGLREALGDSVDLVHEPGYPEALLDPPQIPDAYLATVDAGSGIRGWRVEWHNFHGYEGETLALQFRERVNHTAPEDEILVPGLRRNWWATRWSAKLKPPMDGEYTFVLSADNAGLLRIDGQTRIEFTKNRDTSLFSAKVQLRKNATHTLEIEHRHSVGNSYLRFGWYMPGQEIPRSGEVRARALRAAESADLIIFCGGLNHFHDNEGSDRASYSLPGGQDGLIAELADLGKPVTVLLVGGSAHAMPWADKVSAIVWGGYAGGDAGRVFADILLGKVNPSGKLPFSIARRLEDYPARALHDVHPDRLCYPEGLLVGYRWFDAHHIDPLFPFGHGLGYSPFALENPACSQQGDGTLRIGATLRNQGGVAGSEVVQLYRQGRCREAGEPLRVLCGFQKHHLGPGEHREVEFSIPSDPAVGDAEYYLGFSSRDLPLAFPVATQPPPLHRG